MAVFKIKDTDFSEKVIAGSYAVNNTEVCNDVADGYGIVHRVKIRDKITGKFDMYFSDITAYNNFLNTITDARDGNTNSVPITVSVNNLCVDKTINAFVSHTPVRNRKDNWDDFMERFTVTIEER